MRTPKSTLANIFLIWRNPIKRLRKTGQVKVKNKGQDAQPPAAIEKHSEDLLCCILYFSNWSELAPGLASSSHCRKRRHSNCVGFFLMCRKQARKKTGQNEMQKCSFCGWVCLQIAKPNPVILGFFFGRYNLSDSSRLISISMPGACSCCRKCLCRRWWGAECRGPFKRDKGRSMALRLWNLSQGTLSRFQLFWTLREILELCRKPYLLCEQPTETLQAGVAPRDANLQGFQFPSSWSQQVTVNPGTVNHCKPWPCVYGHLNTLTFWVVVLSLWRRVLLGFFPIQLLFPNVSNIFFQLLTSDQGHRKWREAIVIFTGRCDGVKSRGSAIRYMPIRALWHGEWSLPYVTSLLSGLISVKWRLRAQS